MTPFKPPTTDREVELPGTHAMPRRTSGEHPRDRASDRTVLGWIRANLALVFLIGGACWTGATWFALAIGFRWVNPKDDIAALQLADVRMNRRIDSLALGMAPASVVDSIRRDARLAMTFSLWIVRSRCTTMSAEAASAANIPCDSLLSPYGRRSLPGRQ
jgi:hypothetical protein